MKATRLETAPRMEHPLRTLARPHFFLAAGPLGARPDLSPTANQKKNAKRRKTNKIKTATKRGSRQGWESLEGGWRGRGSAEGDVSVLLCPSSLRPALRKFPASAAPPPPLIELKSPICSPQPKCLVLELPTLPKRKITGEVETESRQQQQQYRNKGGTTAPARR